MKFLPILLSLAPACFAAAIGAVARQTNLEAETDRLLFRVSITEFLSAREAKQPPELDWSTDGCSSAPDNPFGFNFAPSCYRHDFGYRNYKAQGRFEDGKAAIDDNFRDDLYDACDSTDSQKAFSEAAHAKAAADGTDALSLCTTTADVYYRAVVLFGKKRGEEVDAGLQ